MTQNSNGIIKGRRLAYNASAQKRYERDLDLLVSEMLEETTNAVINFFKKPVAKEFFAEDASVASQARILMSELSKKFEESFKTESKFLSEKMVKNQNKISATALKGSLKSMSEKLTLNTNFLTKDLKETLKASVTENVSLITSIAQRYLKQVEGAVMRSISTGRGLESLVPALQKQKGITYRQAKNIALDQTRKVYNNINRDRMNKLGIEKYEWLHSGGGQKPRKDHIAMNGKIYSLKKPPIIDKKTGERGHPGQAINCGCTMRPILKFNEG